MFSRLLRRANSGMESFLWFRRGRAHSRLRRLRSSVCSVGGHCAEAFHMCCFMSSSLAPFAYSLSFIPFSRRESEAQKSGGSAKAAGSAEARGHQDR